MVGIRSDGYIIHDQEFIGGTVLMHACMSVATSLITIFIVKVPIDSLLGMLSIVIPRDGYYIYL